MVYLPLELEEKVVEFCTDRKIVRKDKDGNIVPSLGSGIVAYLKSNLLGDLPSARRRHVVSTGITKEDVLNLIAESNTSNALSNRLVEADVVHRLETMEQSLSSSTGLGRDEVEKLIQASEGQIMDAVRSMFADMRGELIVIKGIDERVNALQTSIDTINTEKDRRKDNVQFLGAGTKLDNSPPGDKPITKDIRRWLQPIQKDEKFRAIIQTGISDELTNKEIVTRLFDAGYGKNDNTDLYPQNLASAMKTAFTLLANKIETVS